MFILFLPKAGWRHSLHVAFWRTFVKQGDSGRSNGKCFVGKCLTPQAVEERCTDLSSIHVSLNFITFPLSTLLFWNISGLAGSQLPRKVFGRRSGMSVFFFSSRASRFWPKQSRLLTLFEIVLTIVHDVKFCIQKSHCHCHSFNSFLFS